ncbi:MAG: NosD domain-containing protein [Candidatus Bathyarchaeum tardum]|nr:MAG: NosD domain-containing protein [Candidatus Bathyarchaeum tardum]
MSFQQVVAQDTITETVYILSNGIIYSSTNSTVPIEKDGNVYTLTGDMVVYSFIIQASNIVIDGAGFSLLGQGDVGIEISSVTGVTLQNLDLLGGFNYGIYLSAGFGISIIDNTISGNGVGMRIYNSTQNTVTGNTILDNNIGVDLLLTSENTFRNNALDNFRDFSVSGTVVSDFIHDIDDSNTIGADKKIYYLVGEQNLVISPETYPDVGFLALVSCTDITVQNLELANNEQGIILVDTTQSSITGNTITDTTYGFWIFSSSHNTITNNTLTNNNRGIHLKYATFNTISLNEITSNTGGMFLYDSTQNTISANTIEDNYSYGAGISASSLNVFRGNYFINNGLNNNGVQVHDVGVTDDTISISSNQWFIYPAGGNYWNDYSGTDVKSGKAQNETGSDGFGDTPYTIYASVKDEYPLILEGSLIVSVTSPENKTYNVNSLTLTVSVSDPNAIVGYSLDGEENITISGTATLSNLIEGSHKLTVFAKNTEGKESSQTVYFTISEEDTQTPIDNDHPEDLPLTLIAAIAAVAVIGVALLYFLILKKK